MTTYDIRFPLITTENMEPAVPLFLDVPDDQRVVVKLITVH